MKPMALRGSLTEFTLSDVFQLIALSKKTGVLRTYRLDASHGAVWFRDGEVYFAESNWRRERLGDRLVAARKISPAALARAVQVRLAEPHERRLGSILVDEGHITRDVLEAFVREQILDTVFELMSWEDGEFDFELSKESPEEDIGLSVSIENIAMESGRRLEEWERIKRKVPSRDIVFKMSTAPGEGPFEISLKPIEWNLLLLIDGVRSVGELGQAARMTDFDVSRVVYGLFSAGLLEVASEEALGSGSFYGGFQAPTGQAPYGPATDPSLPMPTPEVPVPPVFTPFVEPSAPSVPEPYVQPSEFPGVALAGFDGAQTEVLSFADEPVVEFISEAAGFTEQVEIVQEPAVAEAGPAAEPVESVLVEVESVEPSTEPAESASPGESASFDPGQVVSLDLASSAAISEEISELTGATLAKSPFVKSPVFEYSEPTEVLEPGPEATAPEDQPDDGAQTRPEVTREPDMAGETRLDRNTLLGIIEGIKRL